MSKFQRENWNSPTLAKVKKLINLSMTMLFDVPAAPPTTPITKILLRVCASLRADLPYHPKDYYQDSNFPRLLNNGEKIVAFIAEADGHYRGWLTWAFLHINVEISSEFERFNHRKYYEKHRDRFKNLSLNDPKARIILFYDYLCDYPTSFTIDEKTRVT